jgi:hypothetical protein
VCELFVKLRFIVNAGEMGCGAVVR